MHERDPALVAGGDEPGKVADDPTADGDDGVGAPDPALGGDPADALKLGQGLGRFTRRHRDGHDPRPGGPQPVLDGLGMPGDGPVEHHQRRLADGALGPQVAEIGDLARPDADREPRRADLAPDHAPGDRGARRRHDPARSRSPSRVLTAASSSSSTASTGRSASTVMCAASA